MRIPTILAAACLMLVSCQQEEGCTDPAATNYDPNAVEDDGSCNYGNDPGNPGGGGNNTTTGCNSVTFDGYSYDVVQIGSQCWFAENLRSTIFSNGDPIPLDDGCEPTPNSYDLLAVSYGQGSCGCTESVPEFDACDESLSLQIFGRSYSNSAAIDARNLCPTGWKVPSREEFQSLVDFVADSLGGANQVSRALGSTSYWDTIGVSGPINVPPGENGLDLFGFDAVPAGARTYDWSEQLNPPNFQLAGKTAQFATSSMYYEEDPLGPNYLAIFNIGHLGGFAFDAHGSSGYLETASVRCIKDE